MPAKNAALTIEAAIGSTLKALPRKAELLVMNDASSDNTARILRKFRDRRLRVIKSDEPLGVASSLNQLLGEAEGSIIGRMDADDVSFPWWFRYQYHHVRRTRAVSFASVVHFADSALTAKPGSPVALSATAMNVALLIGNPVAHSTMMAPRDVIVEAGGYRVCLAEDYDLWLRLSAANVRVEKLPMPVIGLRQHIGQVTRSANWAERSHQELEWQSSYLSLADAQFGAEMKPEIRAAVSAAVGPPAKGRALSDLIGASVLSMSRKDRVALEVWGWRRKMSSFA